MLQLQTRRTLYSSDDCTKDLQHINEIKRSSCKVSVLVTWCNAADCFCFTLVSFPSAKYVRIYSHQ